MSNGSFHIKSLIWASPNAWHVPNPLMPTLNIYMIVF